MFSETGERGYLDEVFVLLQDASSIVALGAAAVAHSASSIASLSSEFTPGFEQLPG